MRHRRWLDIWILNYVVTSLVVLCRGDESATTLRDINGSKDHRGLFSPRMDYDRWKPLGRGDPLKNDPTYDYVPPVLERVHYWIDPALRKPDPPLPLPDTNQKTEILLLGVSSKKPSTGAAISDRKDNYDPFMKFVEGPKFNHPRVPRPHYNLPPSYYPSMFYGNKNKYQERPAVSKGDQQRVPYTILVPPPVNKKEEQMYNKPTEEIFTSTIQTTPPSREKTVSDVTIQESNLIYHSSSLSNQHEWLDKNVYGSLAESSSHVTWRTPTNRTEGNSVIDQKPEGFFVKVHYKTHTNISGNRSNVPNFVTLPPMVNKEHQIMYKGHVSDDSMDIASTYVNIGKPEAQVHPPTGLDISGIQIPSPNMMIREPPIIMNAPPQINSNLIPQTLETMRTMQPPPVPLIPLNTLQTILQKEVTQPISFATENTPEFTSFTETTTNPTTTTTANSLTTDPLFKHYKQEPIKGPMYLIIQGHSKVKTYGPTKQSHGINIQETNEIPTSDEFSVVKHLHNYKKEVADDRQQREGRSGNLQTLTHVVQTGLGAIDFPELEANRRKDEDVQETELVVHYDVGSRRDATSEKYYKGIVESGDVSRKLKDKE